MIDYAHAIEIEVSEPHGNLTGVWVLNEDGERTVALPVTSMEEITLPHDARRTRIELYSFRVKHTTRTV
jgi:hypothetical protein